MKSSFGMAAMCCVLLAAAAAPSRAQEPATARAPVQMEEPVFEMPADLDLAADGKPDLAAKALRFTLGHEVSVRKSGEPRLANNRSWFRLEYAKFFLDSFYVQVDTKLNGFWRKDHRALAEDKTALFESMTQEAFMQYSAAGGQTSIKAGIQRLIWGESEAGAITDEVSPRNFSELFFIPLEESRIGQFMLSVDHFSGAGNWTAFYVPRPKFNKYARAGTAYYLDPFDGGADIRAAPSGDGQHEYGMRWKKTFGKSDISIMAASLIDNDFVLRGDGVDSAGRLRLTRLEQRFKLAGVTFNYALGNFLVKGEVGLKSPRRFNDAALQVMEKNVVDSSLGLSYSLGQSNTVGLEVVNSHVRDWDSRIAGVPKNSNTLVLNTTLMFLDETLSVNWLTIVNRPYTSYQSSLRTSYKWSDAIAIGVDAHLIDVPDRQSGLFRQRGQDQIAVRIQYQF